MGRGGYVGLGMILLFIICSGGRKGEVELSAVSAGYKILPTLD